IYKGKAMEGSSHTEINAWVEAASNGLIKEIVTAEDMEDFVLAMANAIYFKGDWLSRFDSDDTKEGIFTCPGAEADKKIAVDMMTQQGSFNYYEDEVCQVVEIPYKHAEDVAMTLILPKIDNDFSSLNAAFFEKIKSEMAIKAGSRSICLSSKLKTKWMSRVL
ncbi:MAG: hypothetical protein JSR46_06015, partial [Verrucomicrobia bacterium]|nr:hypothetical protein [Verrucomicrobiota bacterium]